MVTDTELLQMLMGKYPTQNADFIMGEFNTYKKLLGESCDTQECAAEMPVAVKEVAAEPAPVKRLTKRQIKYNPQEAITQTNITCCVCGKEFKRLSAVHLATHGATPDEYRKLCGYEPNQPLMGKMIYGRLMSAVKSAQEARVRKRAMTGGTEDL